MATDKFRWIRFLSDRRPLWKWKTKRQVTYCVYQNWKETARLNCLEGYLSLPDINLSVYARCITRVIPIHKPYFFIFQTYRYSQLSSPFWLHSSLWHRSCRSTATKIGPLSSVIIISSGNPLSEVRGPPLQHIAPFFCLFFYSLWGQNRQSGQRWGMASDRQRTLQIFGPISKRNKYNFTNSLWNKGSFLIS